MVSMPSFTPEPSRTRLDFFAPPHETQMTSLTPWLVAFLMAKAPHLTEARSWRIAQDIEQVVLSEQPLWDDPQGRARTALLLASVMWHESKFAIEVDEHTGRQRRRPYVCMMQVRVGRGRTQEGWTAQQLAEDRQKCLRAGLHIAQHSFRLCAGQPDHLRLAAYVSGSCRKGHPQSRVRIQEVKRWWSLHQPSFHDKALLESASMAYTPTRHPGASLKVN